MHARKLPAQELGDPWPDHDQGCQGPRREPLEGTTAMNRTGESDKSVVPQKPANIPGVQPPMVEWVEGRDLAKENPLQHNPPIGHRAAPGGQNALERIRQGANPYPWDRLHVRSKAIATPPDNGPVTL